MPGTSIDSLKTRSELQVNGKTFQYYSLKAAENAGLGSIERLPYSLKVLLENLLRNEDGRTVKKEDIQAIADWVKK
jgi:aconitate hydratase